MKKLLFSHGDKGGVGKSMFAMLAMDYAMYQGKSAAVIEGDTRIDDVALRFTGIDGITTLSIDLDKSGRDAENAVTSLFRHLEEADSEIVILNAPANAHKALDRNAELIIPVAQDLGFEICTAWMVGIEEASTTLANQSIICQMSDRKIAVINRHESEYDADFYWFIHPEYQKTWVNTGGLVGEIPDLASRVALKLKENKGVPLSFLASKDSPLHIVDRQVIKNWLKKSWENAVIPLLND
jgi:hypothetical protein